MTDPSASTFVPVERAALSALTPSVHRVGRAAVAQRAALARLLELADDLRADAVQRLRERGASAAQVERYEAAYEGSCASALSAGAALDAAIAELSRVAGELVG